MYHDLEPGIVRVDPFVCGNNKLLCNIHNPDDQWLSVPIIPFKGNVLYFQRCNAYIVILITYG
jgi:hypothetical protein